MARLPRLSAALAMTVTVGWAARFALGDGPLADGSDALLAADALLLVVVATAGYLLARSRWAHLLLVGMLAFEVAMLATLAWDAGTTLLGGAGLAAGGALLSPPGRRWARTGAASSGPPARVVVLLIGLVACPGVVALTVPDGPGPWHWTFAAVAVISAWAYGRASLAALWALRIAFPAIGLAAAVTAPWPAGTALVAATAGLTALAWLRAAVLAAAPLAPPRVVTYRIPPELAPADVLEAAGLDESGRPRSR